MENPTNARRFAAAVADATDYARIARRLADAGSPKAREALSKARAAADDARRYVRTGRNLPTWMVDRVGAYNDMMFDLNNAVYAVRFFMAEVA